MCFSPLDYKLLESSNDVEFGHFLTTDPRMVLSQKEYVKKWEHEWQKNNTWAFLLYIYRLK